VSDLLFPTPGSYAADKVLLCRAATVPAESTLLTEVNRLLRVTNPCLQRMSTVSWLIPSSHLVVVPLQVALRYSFLPYEVRSGPSLPTMSARVSIDTCAWSTSAILRPRMASTGGPASQEEEVDPQAGRSDSAGKLAAQVRRTFLLRLLASGTYCSRLYYRQGAGRRLTSHYRVACLNARSCSSEA
jgi:hypothetical protein